MIGLYDIIGVPFGYLMRLIYAIFKNYAVSIIVFTIVTRLLMFPVSFSTQKNSARMALLNPKLEKLKKSFGSNPQRLQEEQQKLYQEEGVNPMASCLPTFIQMFLLFGVLDVVYKPLTHILDMSKSIISAAMNIAGLDPNKTGLRGELKIMEHLSRNKEKYSSLGEDFANKVFDFNEKFTILGANLGKTPTLRPETWTKEAVILAVIPFLAGLAQLVFSVYTQMHQKKTNPTMQQAGGCMNLMIYTMPLLSVWMAFTFPAGLGFYWIWSSLISFVITFALNQYFTPERIKVINEKEKEKARIYAEKHPEKKTFMQKLMEQQAELENQQNGGTSAKSANKNKVSRSEQNKQNRDKLKEARKRMAEKYGDEYDDDDEE